MCQSTYLSVTARQQGFAVQDSQLYRDEENYILTWCLEKHFTWIGLK